ncbi:aspartic proteinase precursor [Vanrija albida]|uniref:Aspartic proteinase n=1 Tax=Vanrija albida TaxID=181172 RepID=A0ABR3PX30_9TREE
MSVRCTSGDVTNDPTQAVGIIGMSLRRDKFPDPLWLTLAPHWPEPRFGMYFGKQDMRDYHIMSGPEKNGGVLTLGGVNKSLFTGDINYVPLDTTKYYSESNFFWQVPVDGALVGGVTFGKGTSIIDTGSALIMAPQTVCDAFYRNVTRVQQSGSLGYYYFPCSSAAGITDLSFTFGGVVYTVPKSDLVRFEPSILSGGVEWCSGEVMPTPPGYGNNWIIGDTFLKNVYTVYQHDPPAVGFAQLVRNGTTPVHPASPSSPAGANASGTPPTASKPSGARRRVTGAGIVALGAVL